MRIVRPLLWIGLAGLIAFSLVSYQSLPDEVPRSINAAGAPKDFGPRSPFTWAMIPVMTALMLAFTQWIRGRLPEKPELFNFPGKDELLKLPAEYRGKAIARMQTFMDIIALQLLATMALVQWMIWRAALGHNTSVTSMVLLVSTPVLLIGIGLYLTVIQRAVDEGTRQYESRRKPLTT
jgi:uncharacterized membrane protein